MKLILSFPGTIIRYYEFQNQIFTYSHEYVHLIFFFFVKLFCHSVSIYTDDLDKNILRKTGKQERGPDFQKIHKTNQIVIDTDRVRKIVLNSNETKKR